MYHRANKQIRLSVDKFELVLFIMYIGLQPMYMYGKPNAHVTMVTEESNTTHLRIVRGGNCC